MLKDFNVFGYDTLVKDGKEIVALKGNNVPELTKGMAIELKSDFSKPPPSGFRYGEKVTIIGFREPFKNGSGGEILLISNRGSEAWISPSIIEKVLDKS